MNDDQHGLDASLLMTDASRLSAHGSRVTVSTIQRFNDAAGAHPPFPPQIHQPRVTFIVTPSAIEGRPERV